GRDPQRGGRREAEARGDALFETVSAAWHIFSGGCAVLGVTLLPGSHRGEERGRMRTECHRSSRGRLVCGIGTRPNLAESTPRPRPSSGAGPLRTGPCRPARGALGGRENKTGRSGVFRCSTGVR